MTRATRQTLDKLLTVYFDELGFGIPDTLVVTDEELINLLQKAIKTKTPIPYGDCGKDCFF